MVKKRIEVTNKTGLHARPASEFVTNANKWKCNVFLEKDGKKVNAKSILGILTLGLHKGAMIDIITEGEQEEEALKALVDFVVNLTE